ncbi:unnamed protein product [Phytophthora lilii]|uniref:Unnamed protein product n=1 Tax=Phytophthora lilii TaxID=2077276 RepID=A0A9W6YCM4_9STRA|nr:unnamed protein product [Phytophthora lilii]
MQHLPVLITKRIKQKTPATFAIDPFILEFASSTTSQALKNHPFILTMGRKDKKQQQKEEEKPAANAKGGKKEQAPKEGTSATTLS